MDYSQITNDVLIGTTPSEVEYGLLARMGVGLVINMRFWRGRPPGPDEPQIQYMRLRTFDSPLMPIPLGALRRGAKAALESIGRGEKIYVHCSRGRHRSVAMAAAILIAQGIGVDEAIRLIKQGRAQADPDAFHIRPRILEFARRWNHAMG